MKIINNVKWAVGWTANKSGAALRLGAGVTGDVIGTTIGIAGGVVAVGGAVLAVAGAATYAGGCAVMGLGGRVCNASQAVADSAYDDLMAAAPSEAAPAAGIPEPLATMLDDASPAFA